MAEDREERRYSGILTPDDVTVLRGDAALDPEAMRQARYRIRERTTQAIHDIGLLFRHLPERDRELLFREFVRGDGRQRLLELLEFVFLGCYNNYQECPPPGGGAYDDPADLIEHVVSRAVGGAEWERSGAEIDVDVDISVERRPIDRSEAIERIEAGYGHVDDLAYLVRWCDDTRFLESTVETGDPLQLVVGSSKSSRGAERTELTPERAANWLEASAARQSSLSNQVDG